MKITIPCLLTLLIMSCSHGNHPADTVPPNIPVIHALGNFTVTVVDRAPNSAILQWEEAANIYSSDTIKYKIRINGRLADSNLTRLTDTIRGISPDTAYNGRVYAYTKSGDTASAPFFLDQLNGYIFFGDNNKSILCYDIYNYGEVWHTTINTTGYFLGSPTFVNNVLYINNDETGIWAFNAKTGGKIWNTTFTGRTPLGSDCSPVYSNGKIYTVVSPGIYALNSADGSIAWSYPTDEAFGVNPVLAGNLLISANLLSETHMVALNATTGAVAWKDTFPTQICKNPVVYNNLLIFGGLDGKIYAIDNTNGKPVWTKDLSVSYNNIGSSGVSPVIYKNIVVVANGNSGYYGLNAATGATIWNFPISYFSSPGIGNDKVYFSTSDGTLTTATAWCLDAATGTQVWRQSYATYNDWGTPICVKNRLYIGHNITNGNGIHIFNALTGAPITSLANNDIQWGKETIVDHDTAYYSATSGMQQ